MSVENDTRGNGSKVNLPSAPEKNKPLDEPEEQPIDSVPMYRRKRIIIPILLVLIIGGGAWWYWNTNLRGYIFTDDAFIDADRLSISSKILGRITELAVDEGDTVKEGQVIVKLDASDLKAQLEQSKAALISAQENVKLADVNVDKANDDFKRAESQFKSNVITQEQYEHAQHALDAARAQYSIAVAQVGSAKAQEGVIQTQLQNVEIVAPMNGVVSKRWVLAGDVIQPGQPVFSISDLYHVWVTANFEETKLASMTIGTLVEITVDTYPDSIFHGKVIELGVNTAAQFSLIPPNNASGNYTKITQRVPVKISIENNNPSVNLLPGMSVEVKMRERQ